jgi:hypothetical protein
LSHRCSSTRYDEPAILSYAISSFCPTSADGLHGTRPAGPSVTLGDMRTLEVDLAEDGTDSHAAVGEVVVTGTSGIERCRENFDFNRRNGISK